MKTSVRPLHVGVSAQYGAHRVSRTTEHGVTFDFNGPVSLRERVDINAAIAPTGIRLETYWRLKDANGNAVLCVKANGQNTPAVGHLIVGSGLTTPVTTLQPAKPLISQQVVIPQAVGTVSTPAPAPVGPGASIAAVFAANLPEPEPETFDPEPEVVSADDEAEFVTAEDEEQGHKYVPAPSLLRLWASVVRGVKHGRRPRPQLWVGPSGSGKGDGAQFLANMAGLSFLKVDAASMNAPEDWFGSREVIAEDGVSITTYTPSAFVLHIQKPGLTLIDEATRVRGEHLNVLLPLMDQTHRVTNPLTGKVIQMHPEHYLILAGNRGLSFTSTYAMDPALINRSLIVPFDYMTEEDEVRVAQEATGCDLRAATLFVRFANLVRTNVTAQMALGGTDMAPVSTRQVLAACELVADGLSVDDAVDVTIINGASDEGGSASVVQGLKTIWTGIRPTYDTPTDKPEA